MPAITRAIPQSKAIPSTIIHDGKVMFLKNIWVYRYPSGAVCFYFCRYEDGRGNKQLRPYYKKENGYYICKLPPAQKLPIFEADKIFKNPKKSILFVEGEKAATCQTAKNLERSGWLVSCLPTTPKRTDWTVLSGRKDIYILPDNDQSGALQCLAILDYLPTAKIVRPFPEWPSKADIADYNLSAHEFTSWVETDGIMSWMELEQMAGEGE